MIAKAIAQLRPLTIRKADREPTVGFTYVTVAVTNLIRRDQKWQGLFLVDTGALDCMAPARHLDEIGIERRRKRTYELADGSTIEFDVGGALLDFMGDQITLDIIFGPDDAEPLLGVLALEAVGIEVDPVTQQLKRRPALRLKSARRT